MTTSGVDLELANPQRAGVFFVLDEDIGLLEALTDGAGLQAIKLNLHGCHDKTTLLERMAHALQTPAEQGCNWDAFSDQLRDLSWRPATGYVLLLAHATALRDSDDASFNTLLEILDDACAAWKTHGVAFWAFLAVPDTTLTDDARADAS